MPQLNNRCELVVFDSNSEDQTEYVCKSLFAQYAAIKTNYHKSEKKNVIDRDIEKAVTLASGQYVWLFSADDVMLPEAVATILLEIKSGLDIYLTEHILCDYHLNRLRLHPIFDGSIKPGQIFDTSLPKEKDLYFKSAKTSEAFFSFLSTRYSNETSGTQFQIYLMNITGLAGHARGDC